MMMAKNDFDELATGLSAGVIVLIIALALITLLTGFFLFTGRAFGTYAEESRRIIDQQSVRRQEGVSQGIVALCTNMRIERDPASKKAFANLIVVQAGGTGTPISPDALACKVEAENQLAL